MVPGAPEGLTFVARLRVSPVTWSLAAINLAVFAANLATAPRATPVPLDRRRRYARRVTSRLSLGRHGEERHRRVDGPRGPATCTFTIGRTGRALEIGSGRCEAK
jgi:hypothetical protein